MNAPCHNCTERKPHCHSVCERYKEFEKQNIVRREKNFKEKKQENAYIENVMRLKRKSERKERKTRKWN